MQQRTNTLNIIYELVNLNKETWPNKYVGSKSGCKVVKDKDGIATIISVRNGKPYYGSSSNQEMRNDLVKGDIFTANILEIVPSEDRKILREREDFWLKRLDVARSEEYYNITDCAIYSPKFASQRQSDIANKFGETMKKRASENSSMAKRDNRAKQCGFNNYGLLYLYIHDLHKQGFTYQDISESLGQERHFAARYLKDFDMDKAIYEIENKMDLIDKVRDLWWQGATLAKISELTGLEKVSARYFLGDYAYSRDYGVSWGLKKSPEELEVEITKAILDGKDFVDVANDTGLVLESVKRYFFRCIRRRLKSSDL